MTEIRRKFGSIFGDQQVRKVRTRARDRNLAEIFEGYPFFDSDIIKIRNPIACIWCLEPIGTGFLSVVRYRMRLINGKPVKKSGRYHFHPECDLEFLNAYEAKK